MMEKITLIQNFYIKNSKIRWRRLLYKNSIWKYRWNSRVKKPIKSWNSSSNRRRRGNNLVDRSRPLRYEIEKPISKYTNTKFNLYIPLIEKLKDGQNYEAYIPQGDIIYYSDVNTGGNRCYRWKFNTNYFPKAERLYEGSVPERYDWRYPIVIDGYMFHYNTTVYFRDGNGKLYSPDNVKITDNTLYIYLPKRALPVGLYDIIINNGTPYSTEMVYGVFSVVEQGDHVPNEEYRIKDESSLGTVKETIKTSEDTLEVNRRHTDRGYLEINLDELMGTTTWVRKIEYPASWNDKINELVLKSKWTNVTIEDLKLHDYADNRQIELRIGRVEPSMADILKSKLIEYNIKSNFIEVSGANFDFNKLTIEIPYFESDGSNLKLLRYDEESRDFEEINYYINLIDGKVTGYTTKPGIFVIAE